MANGEITPRALKNADTRNVRRLARFLGIEEQGKEINVVISLVVSEINPFFWQRGMY